MTSPQDEDQEEIFSGDNADKSPDNVDEDSVIDYGEEVSRIEEAEKARQESDGPETRFVNLPEGKTTLKMLNDGNKTTVNFGTEDNPDMQDKVMFNVKVTDGHVFYKDEDGNKVDVLPEDMEDSDDDVEYVYSVTEASTKASQWGQVARVGEDRNGLDGEELTFVRTGTGTDTNYTVLEAADLE